MIRLHRPYLALLEALGKLGSAMKPTDVLLHRACVSFAEMLSEMTGKRCVVWIGETPIAREK